MNGSAAAAKHVARVCALAQVPDARRVLALLIALAVLARCTVLYAEAYSLILNQRIDDDELIQICSEGAASRSPRMRSACLDAQSERSSPAIVKAFQHAAYRMTSEICGIMGTPVALAFAALSLLLLLGSWPLAMIVRTAAIVGRLANENDYRQSPFRSEHSIVVVGQESDDELEMDGHRYHPSLIDGSLRSRASSNVRLLESHPSHKQAKRSKWI